MRTLTGGLDELGRPAKRDFLDQLAIVLGITIVSYLVLRAILGIVTRRLNKLATGSKTKFLGSPPNCFQAPAIH